MPDPQGAFITPSIITWAREQEGVEVGELAVLCGVRDDVVESWEAGTARPSMSDVQMMASFLDVPFGYFWLSEPPKPVPDVPLEELREAEASALEDYRDAVEAVVRAEDRAARDRRAAMRATREGGN